MSSAPDIAARLYEELRRRGDELLVDALRPAGAGADGGEAAALAAAGPRCAGHREEYETLVAMIREGYLLHYRGRGQVVEPADSDLALLLGDRLYALGLERLAQLGDLDAVAELADVIALSAQVHAECRPELADAVWAAGAVAVGWGSDEAHQQAKDLARGNDVATAGRTLQAWAQQRREAAG